MKKAILFLLAVFMLCSANECERPYKVGGVNADNINSAAGVIKDDILGADSDVGIGSYHAGGIVFYLDGNGGGMVVALNDTSSGAVWGCSMETGADGTGIGSGALNTVEIANDCGTSGIAPDLCYYYTGGGYTDWFLPSTGEASEILSNQTIVDSALSANNGTQIVGDYWSSTEFESGSGHFVWNEVEYAYIWGGDVKLKSETHKVRAVRTF